MSARSVRRRFLVLRGLRWFPTGLLIPIGVLLMLDRGLSLAEIGVAVAAQGVLVFCLELPTGGLSDAIGRRPVLMAATVFEMAAMAVFFIADTLVMFILVFALEGIYRSLDSGPLDAWYVDATLAEDRDANIEGGLSAGGVVLGVAIGGGALLSGGLVALGPVSGVSALALPVLIVIALRIVELVAIAVLVKEVRPGKGAAAFRASVRQVPSVMRGAARVVRGSTVLIALVSVELFWGFGMVAFENLLPPRLTEVVGGAEQAAAILGPTAAVAWLVSAAGAALVPLLTRWLGPALTAAAMRILQGGTVVVMGLAGGIVGVVAAYLATYAVHGASNPIHAALLHRQVTSEHRTTVLSANSMAGMPAAAVGAVVLGWLADQTSVSTAIVVGGVILALAAPLYLPAHRQPRLGDHEGKPAVESSISS